MGDETTLRFDDETGKVELLHDGRHVALGELKVATVTLNVSPPDGVHAQAVVHFEGKRDDKRAAA